jgi:spore germination protein
MHFRKYRNKEKQPSSFQIQNKDLSKKLISSLLLENITEIQNIFSDTPDLVVRNFVIKQTNSHAALVYLSGLTNTKTINNHILSPLLFEADKEEKDFGVQVSVGDVKEKNMWQEIESEILQGNSVLFIDKENKASIFKTAS